MSRRWLLILPAALAVLLALATGAMRHHKTTHATVRIPVHGPLGPRLFGFNDNAVLMGEADAPTELARNRATGANVIRYSVNWDYVQPKKGQFNWNGYDPLYAAALARHIRPILIVLGSPSWARPTDLTCVPHPEHCKDPPDTAHDADFSAFVTTLVNRYPRAAALEVWNEPNLIQFWQSGPDSARYAQLVDLAYDAVKQARSGMPVLAGSLNNTQYDGGGSVNFPDYLEQFLAAKPRFDALSLHDYAAAGSSGSWFEDTLDIARSKLNAAGRQSTPIWVTEFGASTTGPGAITPGEQAKRLVEYLGVLTTKPYVKAAVIHTVIPARVPTDSVEYGFAVMNPDGTPKPAYCALAAARKTVLPLRCPHARRARTLRACGVRGHRARCSRSSSSARRR